MNAFYMFISSKDSIKLYKDNAYDDFYVQFDREIVLEQSCSLGYKQSWQFALVELSVEFEGRRNNSLPDGVLILSDLAEPSYVNATELGVLRCIASKGEAGNSLGQIYYIGVNKTRFNCLRIQVKTRDLKALNKSSEDKNAWPAEGEFRCVLHFTRA